MTRKIRLESYFGLHLIVSGNLTVGLEAISHPMARKGFEMSRISFDAKIS